MDQAERTLLTAIRRVVRSIEVHSQELAQNYGITTAQLSVLRHLEAGASTPGDLARELHVSQPTVSVLLDRLVAHGLVRRGPPSADRRRHLFELTSEGKMLCGRAPSLLQDRFRERLAALHTWERSFLLAALQRLATLMDAEQLDATPFLTPGVALAGADLDHLHHRARLAALTPPTAPTAPFTHEATMFDAASRRTAPRIALPESTQFVDQDAESFLVDTQGTWREVRFHDYAAIYEVQGLYEALFYDTLRCQSPQVVTRALVTECERLQIAPSSLRALDLGAGNGMVGAELRSAGAAALMGIDILPEAKSAAQRDRPGLYSDYLVADFTRLTPAERTHILDWKPSALVSVAALGFDDVPVAAFEAAVSLLPPGGMVAFNIKEEFLSPLDGSGFGALLRGMFETRTLRALRQRRYAHRLSMKREPIYYVVVVAQRG
jgi:DNA-binding MarR family transcriptional regulator/predicted TPR repeat methyltransferase